MDLEKRTMDRKKNVQKPKVNTADNLAALKAKAGKEPIAKFLDMKLLELSQGYAKVSARLKPEYLNFNELIFGGIVMAVADQAFAYGTNSVITPNVASQFNIHFVSSADATDELIAECRVVRAGKRVCISEMTVTNQDGRLIAKATGTTIPLI
jgi:acyl-CoA thioesterase